MGHGFDGDNFADNYVHVVRSDLLTRLLLLDIFVLLMFQIR